MSTLKASFLSFLKGFPARSKLLSTAAGINYLGDKNGHHFLPSPGRRYNYGEVGGRSIFKFSCFHYTPRVVTVNYTVLGKEFQRTLFFIFTAVFL